MEKRSLLFWFRCSDSTASAIHTTPLRTKILNKKQSEKEEVHYKLIIHIEFLFVFIDNNIV